MPFAGFEIAIPVIELPLTYALDLTATGSALNGHIIMKLSSHYAVCYKNVMFGGPVTSHTPGLVHFKIPPPPEMGTSFMLCV
jgi:hypothetical protein